MESAKTLTILPKSLMQGQYNWHPKNMDDALLVITHLQKTVQNKDERIITLLNLSASVEYENNLLHERIYDLKRFLKNIGLKTM